MQLEDHLFFSDLANQTLLTRAMMNFYNQSNSIFMLKPQRIFYLGPNFLLLFWQNNQFHDSVDLIALL